MLEEINASVEEIEIDSILGDDIAEPEEGDSDYSDPFSHISDGNITDDNLWHPHIKGILS